MTDTSKTQTSQTETSGKEKEAVSLIVYSGAGLKKPMEEIKKAFEAENSNVTIQYVYAGSAQLLSQIETSGKGDVFMAGSESAYQKANEKGFANEKQLIAHHTPTIAVQKGNPKGITSLADMQQEGLRVVLLILVPVVTFMLSVTLGRYSISLKEMTEINTEKTESGWSFLFCSKQYS